MNRTCMFRVDWSSFEECHEKMYILTSSYLRNMEGGLHKVIYREP